MSEATVSLKSTSSGAPVIDWQRGQIGSATLRPQSLAVLKLLHDRPGQIVTKDQIMAAVWPGVAVTDDSLVQCITEIRKALGDAEHTVVKTLPKRGYVFEPSQAPTPPPVREKKKPVWLIPAAAVAAAGILAAAFWPKPTPSHADLPAIAVLPFTNLSVDPKGEKFADVLTEDVITNLSHSKNFAVIARNSSDVYKGKSVDVRQVGKDLNAKYVLEGSVQALPGKVFATAQFIDAETGKHIWSDKIEKEGDDVFDVEKEITGRIAQSIVSYSGVAASDQWNIIRRKPPNSWSAYEAYQAGLEAKHSLDPARFAEAEAHLRRAIEIDPTFARPHVVMAWVANFKIDFGVESRDTAAPRYLSEAQKAVALDPMDGEAHSALSFAYAYSFDYQRMVGPLEKALELSPNNADVLMQTDWLLVLLGRKEEGQRNIDRALRLNPNHPPWFDWNLRSFYFHQGDYQRAYGYGHKFEDNSPLGLGTMAISAAALGKLEDAAKTKNALLAMVPDWSLERAATLDWNYYRQDDIDRFVAAGTKAGLPLCALKGTLPKVPNTVHLPQCDAERAKASP